MTVLLTLEATSKPPRRRRRRRGRVKTGRRRARARAATRMERGWGTTRTLPVTTVTARRVSRGRQRN
jgi:hypothetical protein